MKVKKSNPSETEIVFTIVAEAKDLSPIKVDVVKMMSKSVKVTGFRPGHAPANLIEKAIDPNMLQQEFLDAALTQFYRAALQEYNIRPISDPTINIKKFVPFTDLEVDVTTYVFGATKLADYKKFKIKQEPAKVSKDQVEVVITNLRTRASIKNDVDRAAKLTDQVWIDFEGTNTKGEPVEGASGKDYPLALGSNTFIPGFEDNVVGMKANDEKTFTVPFPKDYGVKDLQGKKVSFKVTATKVQEVVLPSADDEFAKSVGPFEDIKQLRTDIESQLLVEAENQSRRKLENDIIAKVIKESSVAIPKILIDDQIDRIESEERRNIVYKGQTWEEHLAEEKVTAEEHREQKRPQAEERVKAGFLLGEIAEVEKLDVNPEELQMRLTQLRKQHKTDQKMIEEIEKPENQRNIAAQILTEKTLDLLVDFATK